MNRTTHETAKEQLQPPSYEALQAERDQLKAERDQLRAALHDVDDPSCPLHEPLNVLAAQLEMLNRPQHKPWIEWLRRQADAIEQALGKVE